MFLQKQFSFKEKKKCHTIHNIAHVLVFILLQKVLPYFLSSKLINFISKHEKIFAQLLFN